MIHNILVMILHMITTELADVKVVFDNDGFKP